jgi:hypothetical protein
MSYLSDGVNLYEVVYERDERNYGRAGGSLHVLVVRDVQTDVARRMGSLERALCEPVAVPVP